MELRGLVIKGEFLEKILTGRKTWEIRSRRTHLRGDIALIQSGSGCIVGTAKLVDCIGPLTDEDFLRHARKVGVTRREVLSWDPIVSDEYAWVLAHVRRLPRPVPYQHPQGAVTWVKLDPRIRRRIGLAPGI